MKLEVAVKARKDLTMSILNKVPEYIDREIEMKMLELLNINNVAMLTPKGK